MSEDTYIYRISTPDTDYIMESNAKTATQFLAEVRKYTVHDQVFVVSKSESGHEYMVNMRYITGVKFEGEAQ